MPGTFGGINLASSALRTFQRSMETTGHNIANVNTRGYSRQIVEPAANDPIGFWERNWKSIGTGVHLGTISRVRDAFVDQRQRLNASDANRSGTLAAQLKEIDAIFGEPGEQGISAALSQFFDGWSALGSNPGGAGLKSQVRSAGQRLSDRIQGAYASLLQQEQGIVAEAKATLGRIQSLGDQIAELNKAIREQSMNQGSPNDLLDQRERAVQELASLVDVQVSEFADGTFSISAGGFALVDGAGARTFPSEIDLATGTIGQGADRLALRGGTLSGLMQSLEETRGQRDAMDLFANTLRQEVNALHATGSGGTNFFSDPSTAPGAAGMRLSNEVLLSPDAVATGASDAAGDGSVALGLALLRDRGLAGLGGRTAEDWFASRMSSLGEAAGRAEDQHQTHLAVGAQIEKQQQAVSGVSLDEELSSMLQYQRSYQASAQALKMFDQMTEELLAMLR